MLCRPALGQGLKSIFIVVRYDTLASICFFVRTLLFWFVFVWVDRSVAPPLHPRQRCSSSCWIDRFTHRSLPLPLCLCMYMLLRHASPILLDPFCHLPLVPNPLGLSSHARGACRGHAAGACPSPAAGAAKEPDEQAQHWEENDEERPEHLHQRRVAAPPDL